MRSKPKGLTGMTTEELRKLLRLIYRNEIQFPLNAQRIACAGFQYKHQVLIDALRDLDIKSAQAVIICVLAERIKNE